jgi:DNA-binding response OmpR family regulator
MNTQILCIAANLGERLRIERAFLEVGYSMETCDDPSHARHPLHAYALAVVDGSLADGRALDLLASLRSTPAAADLPVLVLSEDIEVRWRFAALRAGAQDCVGKPCDPQHLAARAISMLNRRLGLASVRAPSGARRILAVDDSATYAYALKDELRKDNHDVALALNGREALDFVAVQVPDLIILDVFLPDLNGIEVCAKMRQNAMLRHTPVLILTGREKSAVRERALQAEASDFAVKSRDLESIRLHARRLISSEDRPAPSSRQGPPSATLSAAPKPALLDKVAAASGLSAMVGRSAVEGACRRAGIDPATLTAEELQRVLPELERVLRLFLPPETVDARVAGIAKLTGA